MSRVVLIALSLAALVAAFVLFWRGGQAPSTEAVGSQEALLSAGSPEPAVDAPAGAEPEDTALPRIPLDVLADNRDLGTGESREVLARLPTEIDYPFQEKYAGETWSEVPHELIAAHDGQQEHEGEGARRLFIAVVEPDLPDAEVEQLVRDLRARHREAEALRVRVFDSHEAARRPSWTDGGAARKAHLVGDLYRDGERERLLVRGREVAP